jgi:hypothetical protein
MGLLDGTIKNAGSNLATAGVTLENNAFAKLEQTLTNLEEKVGPEGETLILDLRNALNMLLASGVQAGQALIAAGEQSGKDLIDHAAKYEVYLGIRLKPSGAQK